MPKPKKSKVEPVPKEERKEEEARRLMPPPPPRSPKRKAPATPVEPDSPGLPARKAAKSTTAELEADRAVRSTGDAQGNHCL